MKLLRVILWLVRALWCVVMTPVAVVVMVAMALALRADAAQFNVVNDEGTAPISVSFRQVTGGAPTSVLAQPGTSSRVDVGAFEGAVEVKVYRLVNGAWVLYGTHTVTVTPDSVVNAGIWAGSSWASVQTWPGLGPSTPKSEALSYQDTFRLGFFTGLAWELLGFIVAIVRRMRGGTAME